jgi:hypothetical protein
VLNTGDPVLMPWADRANAILQMWYPGQEGGTATADLLLGDPKSDPGAFHYATCHGHYHFRDYADYVLKKLDGAIAVQGHKESFCVEDNIQGSGRNLKPRPAQQVQGQPAPPDTWDTDTQTNCLHPGLHIGWADGYFNTTEGNWLDITGLAPGDYKLSVTVNPHHTIEELDYSNNGAEIPVHVPDPSADGTICPATLDAIYKCTSSTQRKKCFAGLTTTDDCTPPKQCAQFVEIAHSAACQ